MPNWTHTIWGDVITLQRGYDITKNEQVLDGAIPVVSSGGVSSFHDRSMNDGPGVVMGRKGTLGKVHYVDGPFWPHDTTLWVADFKGNHPKFVYYALRSIDLSYLNVGSASPTLNRNHVHPLPVIWPSTVDQQRAIAEVLGALDDKIAANRRTIRVVDDLTDAVFESHLSRGCETKTLGEIAEFHNKRRIPLSSREREVRKGSVPYYGAAGAIGFVDESIFDQVLLLVGEDGSVVTPSGNPVLQYVWGPAWVNNHAHVLTGSGISTELLRAAVSRSNIQHLITGAVQPKLSMRNLKELSVEIPAELAEIDELAVGNGALIRSIVDENRVLIKTRDELLPLLMSGKLRVKDAEQIVEEIA
ncbi:restriction endonuclease subunit S [Nocardia thailandica]